MTSLTIFNDYSYFWKESSVKDENRDKNQQIQSSIKSLLEQKLLQKETIEKEDPKNGVSTIDAFQPFQKYMKEEEKKDINAGISFGAPNPSRNPKLTWIKVRTIQPNIARNLALFGKPFAGRRMIYSPKKTQKLSSSLMKSLIPEWKHQ